ncbi:MAG: class I SAM-dependent methyltransferase [Bacteroidetes bacterium]|nr:class I SAM-dependent methyltransferase [Bacteroidota bacterium]
MDSIFSSLRDYRNSFRYFRLQKRYFASGLGDSAWILHGLVRALKPRVCVEIGAAMGKSACYIGMALKENRQGKLYSIDPHEQTDWNDTDQIDTYNSFIKNIHDFNLDDYVEIVRNFSNKVGPSWKLPIDIIFIDGDHSYEGVKRDWSLFSPMVSEFGLVVFHDTLWDIRPDPRYARADMGVPRFVEELRSNGYPVVTFDKNFGVSLVQPTKGGILLSK